MFPEQPQQNGQQPHYTPAQPPYGTGVPQQHVNGQYEVLPPLPNGQNNGHSGHNPYEFIVNPNTAKRRGSLLSSNAFVTKIAVIAGGAVLLMIVAGVVISALAPKSNAPDLLAIAQRQQEIIRVSSSATTLAAGDDTKNLVTNINVTLTSDKMLTLSYLMAHGMKKVPAKTLALDKSAETDNTLASAATAGNYDAAAVQNLTGQLQTYERLLQKAYNETHGPIGRKLLQTDFTNADLLLQQAKKISNTTP
jgi:hypothetical protein